MEQLFYFEKDEPKHPALSGADNGTSISCLTPTAWPISNLQSWNVPRCYFQAGGSLKEVLFNGSSWVAFGNLMP